MFCLLEAFGPTLALQSPRLSTFAEAACTACSVQPELMPEPPFVFLFVFLSGAGPCGSFTAVAGGHCKARHVKQPRLRGNVQLSQGNVQ
mmetsp:Transcript_122419/g.391422  ORF Transcript_122419/g.391422 Transcript_122419/m.391422 type:complete len:89 (+) Transcript_122419:3926-4192(+)